MSDLVPDDGVYLEAARAYAARNPDSALFDDSAFAADEWFRAAVDSAFAAGRRAAVRTVEDHLLDVGYWEHGGTRHVRDAIAYAKGMPDA